MGRSTAKHPKRNKRSQSTRSSWTKRSLKLFEELKKFKVRKSGLWVSEEYGFLGASPDGIVDTDAIVEVKCIYAPNEDVTNMGDLIRKMKSRICLKNNKGQLTLKKQHSYYYQVQGQLNICKKDKCYFVVYVNDKIPLFVEEIKRDSKFWEEKMLPGLVKFYKECIGPEIVRGNLKKGRKCVDPPYIEEAIQNKYKTLPNLKIKCVK